MATCPECGGILKPVAGKKVCQQCGLSLRPHEVDEVYDERNRAMWQKTRQDEIQGYREWYNRRNR
jgi:transcription initiation factor TFIIIB Brf1 subunit/transcription initiation factor TFIIB